MPNSDQPAPNGLSGADMLALVAHITGLLSEMEGRIMGRLAGNADAATERWRLHDAASDATIGGIREEIGILRADFTEHLKVANAHFAKEHDEEVAMDARVRPVRSTLAWTVEHWGQILLFLFGLLGFLAIAADVIARYIGGQS